MVRVLSAILLVIFCDFPHEFNSAIYSLSWSKESWFSLSENNLLFFNSLLFKKDKISIFDMSMQFLPFILETKSFIRVKTLYKFCKEEKRLWSVGGSLFKFNAFKQTYISGKFPLVKVLLSCQTNKLIFQKRQTFKPQFFVFYDFKLCHSRYQIY